MPTPIPPATSFERDLHDAIVKALSSASGTVWTSAQRVLAAGLSMAVGDVGLIGVTDAGVINNRPLSAGLITEPRRFLVIPVLPAVGVAREVDAIKFLMPRTRHLTTVGLAGENDDGAGSTIWRVERIIEVAGFGIGEQLRPFFPLVEEIDTQPLAPLASEPWMIAAEPTSKPSALVELAFDHPFARSMTPGDRILFVDSAATPTEARGAGVISSVTRGARLQLIVEPVIWFPSPVPI